MKTIFDNLNELKTTIKDRILSNQKILKYIVYNEDDPLSLPDIDDPQSLINEYIYLNPIVWDETIQKTKTFLLTSIRIASISNRKDYANIYLYFYVICHNDLFTLGNGHVRNWDICSELTKSFDSTYGSWIGECNLIDMTEITTRKDYYALELKFSMTDFKKSGGEDGTI